jgi:peptidylprolyl isomerase
MKNLRCIVWCISIVVGIGALFSCGGTSAGPDVVIPVNTDSVLISRDIVVGTGARADSGLVLTVRYVGRLKSDTTVVFDSSGLRRAPFSFLLGTGEVIKGWDSAMVGMRVGGRRRIEIPPTLGYGLVQTGPIPPNSSLIFDVELLRIDSNKLVIQDLVVGQGTEISTGSAVTVLYTGRFLNSVQFDSNDGPGRVPFFVVVGFSQVIEAWNQGLVGMRVGGTRRLTVPPSLGYGTKGSNNNSTTNGVPPSTIIIFDIRLIGAN